MPKFSVKQHRWRENSYVFQVGGVLFEAFVSEAFFGLKTASNWFVLCTKKYCREYNISSKIDCRGAVGMVREVWRFP